MHCRLLAPYCQVWWHEVVRRRGLGKVGTSCGDCGGWELKTVKTWAFADLHFYYSRWLGNRKYKKANTMNVASGSVFNKTMAQWRFLFLPSGHWYWSHIRHYLGRVQWTKYTYNRQKCLYAGIKMSESVVKKWLQKRLWLWINCVCWCWSFVWEDED